jgi:hypothetical protein
VFDDDSVDGILVAHRPLGQQQTFKAYGLDRDAIKIDCLCVTAQGVERLSVCTEQEIDDEGIGNADLFCRPPTILARDPLPPGQAIPSMGP